MHLLHTTYAMVHVRRSSHSLSLDQLAHHVVHMCVCVIAFFFLCLAPLALPSPLLQEKYIFTAEYASAMQSAPTKKREVLMSHLQSGCC